MKPLLIVIDMQNDFISMALSTARAQAIVSPVVSKIKGWDGPVLYTRDTHPDNYLETAEGKKLPISHCIKGSIGWQLNEEIQSCVVSDDQIIDKPTFGSLVLTDRVQQMAANHEISSITLAGLCTDICVISNALLLKAALWELPIAVDSSCCAGVTVQSHNNALEAMKMCQIDIL